jgi:DHA2 family multidrug resistance protein-like MFS transporter
MLMVAIDVGILNLVIPAIQAEFDPSQSTIGLMSSISTLMLAAFILGGGTLGDLYGRRRFIMIGTAGILAMAIASMLAPSPDALIGMRAMGGIFQAMVNPLTLTEHDGLTPIRPTALKSYTRFAICDATFS